MATAAAAVAAKIRRDVISHFLQAKAVSPETAIAYDPTRLIGKRMFARFQRDGVILPGKDGGYYVDVAVLDDVSRRRRRRVGGAIAGGIAIAAALAAFIR